MFKISTSEFGTVSMRRQFRACAYEFLTAVTEGVVHGIHNVMIWLSFGVIRRHKARGGTWKFHKVAYEPRAVVERKWAFRLTPITANYTACSVNNSDKMG